MGRLLISAAHTLENPGAIYQDLREADLTRKLLKLCIPHLEKSGIVYQAVPLDLPLLQRIEWINATGYTEEQGDIMVELHINDGGKRGIEGWFRGSAAPDNKSQKLTESLSNYICEKLKYTNLGSKSEYEHELTSLLILNSINSSGTAIEILFIDNPEDIAILKDDVKLDEVAKTIVDGIKNYLDNPDKPVTSTIQNPVLAPAGQNPVAAAAVPAVGTPAPVQPVMPIPAAPMPAAAAPQPPVQNFGGYNPPTSLPSAGFGGNTAPSFGGAPAPRPYGGMGAQGLGGNSTFGGGFGAGGSSFGGGAGGNKATLMDRDERKKMIKEIYQLILGKDPKPADENYYLNTGINREELIKKLTESEDFKKMVEDSKKVKDLEDKIQKLESEVNVLKANSKDFQDIQVSLNKLLEQKNIMISRLYTELVNHGIINTGEHFESRKKPEQLNAQMSGTSIQEPLSKRIAKFVMRFTKV